MMKISKDLIIEKLDLMIPNPSCELNYYDDFSLLISIILSAQATDEKVNKVTKVLFEKYKEPRQLKNAKSEVVENIIHSLGLYKNKAKNIISTAKIIDEKYNGKIPLDVSALMKLPGVGNKTAKVFLVEHKKANYFPVDTHVARVAKRLNIVYKEDSVVKVEKKMENFFKKENLARIHQQFVLHGRYTCKARKPMCSGCLLSKKCPFYIKNKLYQ